MLGDAGAAEHAGSCDPQVVRARAVALAPSLSTMTASRRETIISLQIEVGPGQDGTLALQIDEDQFVTSSDAGRLPPAMKEALNALGPSLAEDPVVLAELSQCEGDGTDIEPSDVIKTKERNRKIGGLMQKFLESFEVSKEPEDIADAIQGWQPYTENTSTWTWSLFAAIATTPWSLMWILVVATGLVSLVSRVRPSRRAERVVPELPMPDRAAVLPLMLGAMVVSMVYMVVSADGLSLRHDSIRDLAVARDFWIDGVGTGTHTSSVTSVQHGRLWPAVLGVLQSSGASLGFIHALRDLGIAAATALCVLLTVRLHGAHGAWAAALVAGTLGPWLAVHPLLWNPALATLPLAALFLVCSLLLERGGPRLAAGAGALAGIAMQAHPVNALTIPLVAGVASVRSRSTFDPPITVAVAFFTVWLIDPQWLLRWESLVTAGPISVAITLGVPLAIGLGGLVRGGFERLSASSQQQVFIYVSSVLLAGAIVGAAFLVELPRRYYLAAIVPAAACLGGWLGARILAPWATPRRHAAAWLVALGVAQYPGAGGFANETRYFLEDVERMGAQLHARGIPRERAGTTLQAPWRFAHVVAMPLLYPDGPPGPGSHEEGRPLQAFFAEPETTEAPAGWDVVELPYHSAFVRVGPVPWADWREFETCALLEGKPWCQLVLDAGVLQPEKTWLQRASGMSVTPWPEGIDGATITQRIRVRAPSAGTRYLVIDKVWEFSECTQFECSPTDHIEKAGGPHIVELTSPGPTEGQLVLKQRESGNPDAIIGLIAELESIEPWMVESLTR